MNKAAAYAQFDNRAALVERHTPLVKRIAHHLLARLPASVQLDDLLQSGMVGLLEAARNFDGSKGASFETFAGIRIRGAMLDEIRRGDWTPRSVHRNSRRVTDAMEQLERQLGRDPTGTEVADYLELSVDEYHHILHDVSAGKLVGLDDLGVSEDAIGPGEESSEHFDHLADGRFQSALVEAIKTLPEREALVLSLYYDEELNLKEIGQVLGVSESRVSQIHSQSMVRLKTKLRAWRE
ncbi:RNA polymerase, sigma 28 subunit, SigD/FliA/WhiG [Ferrimonas balearica DSM 9799]|uniref:RNA polymerase sigma factor FliA n=1 Tax=Ferrimonas balearica (strain DSM 9799 / CCM 4581 / KCTC 23876 / PAT) TaxID=550540 RepID=E1SUS0_FERBD|nr:RNA polymerase sigma factor FliA [Ferrimonas balearica]MBY6018256.1 RNA polymerase sigma factor FliA [Halomonas denitrificans]ADN75261.1 RNA polymerase, sigma 28 subunit, SigD/FliA/WhiG [Ferrimonas balearica DSM 9799]MBW3138168.1 RNA polymerase sigma factor FliA [Ferrimonas balearica]MBW3164277.1 RNA polymerase sigma factor FliA [Ferrimonas balearica]MBY5978925.1 RNA polymerase sigma factor FliA [Ferrimonas balearica]